MLEENIIEQVSSVLPKKPLTIKRVLLYIVTLYFIIIILKMVGKFLIKSLDMLREYIHNLTNKEKMVEVLFYTFVGVVLGVLLNKQILQGIDYVVEFWNTNIMPYIMALI